MTAAAAPVSPMDPRLALLVAAHDQTHRELEIVTDEVRKNHQELSNRFGLLDTRTEAIDARITVEVGLLNRKLDEIERTGATVKDHVILMTGRFGELDKKVTLLDERLTGRIDAMDARLDKMEARLDKMEARLDKMEARLDKMEARLDAMDARLDKMEARLDTIVELLTTGPRE